MDPESYIVGLGHPRCGTGFTTNLLKSAGIAVGHERLSRDGVVSWMLIGERARNPWGDALGSLQGFRRTFCVARSPMTAIPSIVPENRKPRSLRFRSSVLQKKSNWKLPSDLGEPSICEIELAVRSYVAWYELILQIKPATIYRVDRGEDDELLSDFVGMTVRRNENIKRNSRPYLEKPSFVVGDLEDLSKSLTSRLITLAERLGYPEEAKEIQAVCGHSTVRQSIDVEL